MTPEERQLLTTLADRIKNTPPQQKDAEADQLLRQLTQERPDTVYILAQTVLMQDFALRNAQAQIDDLRRQLSEAQAPSQSGSGSGSFLGGLFGGGGSREPQSPSYAQSPSYGSVPRVNPGAAGPWEGRPYPDSPPPPSGGANPAYGAGPGYGAGGPVMQPSQTGGFLRSAAQTAAGVAGGALLFQGISSLFSGHQGSLLGGGLGGITPRDSLSETTVVNNYYDDAQGSREHSQTQAAYDEDHGHDDGIVDASYDSGDDDDFGGGDFA